MKKVLCAVLLVSVFAVSASAEVVGALTRITISPEAAQTNVAAKRSAAVRSALLPAYGKDVSPRYYNSMIDMLMALQAGEIDSMALPECVSEYILRTNQKTEIRGLILGNGSMKLVMGLKEGNESLRNNINAAIMDMQKDGTLDRLIRIYVVEQDSHEAKPEPFDEYDNADTLKVAITGDFPPIDYVDAGGFAAGYNTAMLAELGRRLHMNIQLEYTGAASRAATLMSGRANVVFWFEVSAGGQQFDVPEGIITTTPYYGWNKMMWIGLER